MENSILLSGFLQRCTDFDERISAKNGPAESMLRAIFDNCFQFIALLDGQGRLLEINRCSLEAAGVERAQVIGNYFWDSFFWTKIISPSYRDEFIKSWPRVVKGEFVRFEVCGHLPNGEARTVDFSVNPVLGKNLELLYAVAEARDITSYKNLELELLDKNRALSRMNAELEDFAILASHDLRQPLQSLSMNATILSKLLPEDSPTQLRDQIKHMKTSVGRMNMLLESILDYARSTKRSQEKNMVDCASIVRDALDCLASSIDKAVVRVDWATLPGVYGNRIQLLRIFQNLISNAIKFRDENRPCEVRIFAERKDSNWIFALSDNGVGMSLAAQSSLFKRFSHANPKESRVGVCAGLSICKDLVEQHGGKIWVQSTPGVGSTFYFSIPASHNV